MWKDVMKAFCRFVLAMTSIVAAVAAAYVCAQVSIIYGLGWGVTSILAVCSIVLAAIIKWDSYIFKIKGSL